MHIRILPDREIVAININMTKGDETRVAHIMIARSGRVYNRHDRLAKELLTRFCCAVLLLLFLLTINVDTSKTKLYKIRIRSL